MSGAGKKNKADAAHGEEMCVVVVEVTVVVEEVIGALNRVRLHDTF